MRALFVATWKQLRKGAGSPHMGGEGTGELCNRVVEAARERGTEPRGLFVATLHRWLARELNERELGAPLACFAAAWGGLMEHVNGHAADPRTALMRKCGEALSRKDMATYAQLNEQLAAMGREANAAGE